MPAESAVAADLEPSAPFAAASQMHAELHCRFRPSLYEVTRGVGRTGEHITAAEAFAQLGQFDSGVRSS
jgi:hypothetical protein